MMMKKIGEVCELVSGYAFKSSEFKLDSQKGLPIIRIQNVGNPNSDFVYWESSYDEKFLVNEEDILLSLSGSVKVDIWKGPKALLNQRIVKIIPKSCVNKKWIYWAIHKKIDDISNIGKKSIINNISVNELKKLDIYVPNLEQQNAIVSVLNKAQELIDKRKAQIEALDQLTQSVFLEMFGDPVKNNKNWVMQKLSETGELKRGISKHRPRNAPELLNGPYPLIQTGDIANSGIFIKKYNQTYSELGLKQSKMWPKGTLCITIAANIAQTGILTFDACFPDSVVAYIPKNYMSNIYVHFWFTFLQRIIEANAPESAQKNINLKILSELEIPVPPVELQNKFAEIVQKIESQKDLLQKSLEELENNFNSLMQRAFKGELFND
jgi:type I restriction enzyme, S subunit